MWLRLSSAGRGAAAKMAFTLCAVLAVSACSDGGGSAPSLPPAPPPSAPPPAPPVGPVWTPGVFAPSSTFAARCEAPRSGVDIEGNPFADRQGSALEERFWLRSWSEETYLWNDEIVDRNPADFPDRTAYFDVLRTTALTPSGREKDDFHFTQSTDEFLEDRNSAPSAGYGARFALLSASAPRDVRILFTEPGSPAAQAVGGLPNFIRGARILEVDGLDVVNGGQTPDELERLNDALFPPTAGATHVFLVEDPNGAGRRTVSLTSANISTRPVNRTAILPTASGPVGYVLINTLSPFAAEREIAQAMADFAAAGVADLVLDLRYNSGGLIVIAAQLGHMVAGPARAGGQTFERLRFNADAGAFNPVTGEVNRPILFTGQGVGFSLPPGSALPQLSLPRVYVLTTEATCSASESVVNGLRGVGVEVVLIGGTTCGKPFGFYPEDNCGLTYFTIQFQGVNAAGFGDFADGFAASNSPDVFAVKAPGCAVADDLDRELGDPAEALLAAALRHRADGTCPPAPAASDIGATGRSVRTRTDALTPPPRPPLEVNRDMRGAP